MVVFIVECAVSPLPLINTETVNWGDAYFNVLDTPGIYSEALMNM